MTWYVSLQLPTTRHPDPLPYAVVPLYPVPSQRQPPSCAPETLLG